MDQQASPLFPHSTAPPQVRVRYLEAIARDFVATWRKAQAATEGLAQEDLIGPEQHCTFVLSAAADSSIPQHFSKSWMRIIQALQGMSRSRTCHVSGSHQHEATLRNCLDCSVQKLGGRAVRVQIHRLIAIWILHETSRPVMRTISQEYMPLAFPTEGRAFLSTRLGRQAERRNDSMCTVVCGNCTRAVMQDVQQKGATMAPAVQEGERGFAATHPQRCHAHISMDGPD